MVKVKILKSHLPAKKYDAVFTFGDGHTKTIPFGAARYEDYTEHHDPIRRERYLKRHGLDSSKSNEDWSDPITAGSLSRYVLWGESTDIRENVKEFKRRFHLS
jgi:hypothetical protein